MNCSIQGCPGDYEEKLVAHTVKLSGRMAIIDHVPAEVCSVCGDVRLLPETVRHVEELLKSADRQPSGTVPLYEYAI